MLIIATQIEDEEVYLIFFKILQFDRLALWWRHYLLIYRGSVENIITFLVIHRRPI